MVQPVLVRSVPFLIKWNLTYFPDKTIGRRSLKHLTISTTIHFDR